MNGVLDRMVARTFGSLPSVEPLAKVRLQPIAAEMPRELVTEKQERLTSNSLQQIASREQLFAKHDYDVSMPPMRERAKARNSRRRNELVVHPHEGETSLTRMAEDNEPAPERGTQDNSLPAEASLSARFPSHTKGEEEISTPVRSKIANKELSKVAATREIGIARDESGGITEALQRPPEIQISIGSIELQVAPREERPRSPSFRPRISLENFLSRGQR